MPLTPDYGLPYPTGDDFVIDAPGDLEDLAAAVETALVAEHAQRWRRAFLAGGTR